MDGEIVAYLTTEVSRMRSFPAFWLKREWLWYQVNWVDGGRDRPREDYGPGWYAVAELERGQFEPEVQDGLVLGAQPVNPTERNALWELFGPPR